MELTTLLAIGGTALNVVGQVQQSETEAGAMNANAAAQRRRAMEERAVASVKAERQQMAARRLMSTQRAGFASSGGGMDGSAEIVIGETGRRGLHNARIEMWQGEQRGRGLESEADIQDYSADRRRTGGMLAAGGALLTGVSRIGARDGWFDTRDTSEDSPNRRRFYG